MAEAEKESHMKYIRDFKVNECQLNGKGLCLKTKKCFDYHDLNQRRRRPMQKSDGSFNYSPTKLCTKYNKNSGICPDGDMCPYLHGYFEKLYHLCNYKTEQCSFAVTSKGICSKNGAHCAFAHGKEDVRIPSTILNSRTRTIGKEDLNDNCVYYNICTGKTFIQKILNVFGPYTENIIMLSAIKRNIEDFKNGRNSIFQIFENTELMDHNNSIYTSVSTILEASERADIHGITYFVIAFCGALLNAAEGLLKAGLAPKKIIEYFKLGEKTALKILKTLEVGAPDISYAIDPSFAYRTIRGPFRCLAKPAKILYYSFEVSVENVILHESIMSESETANWINKKMTMDSWGLLLRMADINVVISEKGFDDYALMNLCGRGIMPLTLQNGFDVLRVKNVIGAKPVLELKYGKPNENDVAKVHQIQVENIGGDVYFGVIEIQDEKGNVEKIVVEDATFKNPDSKISKHLVASKRSGFVPGAGATEIEIAHQLISFADRYAEKDEELRLGIKTFAAAFETLPRIMAENLKISGVNDLIQQLKEEHSKGRKNMGLSFKAEGGISDVLQSENYDLMLAKKLGIQHALEAAESILSSN